MEPVDITAGRLHLRPWEAADAEAVLAGASDPLTQRWTQVAVPYTRAYAEDFVGRYVPEQWAAGGELVWGVFDATTGQALATVGLHAARADGVREVGYWAMPAARGSGVMSEAVSTVARWAFAVLDLPRLEWAAEVGNSASLRVAVKAGFAFEGRRRSSLRQRDGSYRDGWWAARLPGDGPDGAPPALPWPGVLHAGDLRLRPWRSDDAPMLVVAFTGDPNSLPPAPAGLSGAEHVRWWVGERAPEQWASGDGAPFAVLGPDGDVAGSLQLMLRGRRAGIAEVGVWVAPAWRGRGTATTAITAMLDWAVPALSLARLEWHASPDNPASLALASRLGFEREGLARLAFPGNPRGDDVVLARIHP